MNHDIECGIENWFIRDMVFDMLVGGSDNGRLLERFLAIVRDANADWAKDPRKVQELQKKLEKASRRRG